QVASALQRSSLRSIASCLTSSVRACVFLLSSLSAARSAGLYRWRLEERPRDLAANVSTFAPVEPFGAARNRSSKELLQAAANRPTVDAAAGSASAARRSSNRA